VQYQVPQFIETEDKIVGPFTLRQFIYIAIGGSLSFMLYFSVRPWLWFLFSIFLVGGSLALAFVKINGRPLLNLFLSMVAFYWRPQVYLWQPDNPQLKKQDVINSASAEGGLLERIVSGMVLKNTWAALQTGSKQSETPRSTKDRYEVFRRLTGERQAARRVDYR